MQDILGRESVSCSVTNWQESFDLIQDYANRALRNRALETAYPGYARIDKQYTHTFAGSQTKGLIQQTSKLDMGGKITETCCSASPKLHPHGDATFPICRIDADVPRHNEGTQHVTDDGASVRVGLEYLWLLKEKNDHDNWPKAYYWNSLVWNTLFCAFSYCWKVALSWL